MERLDMFWQSDAFTPTQKYIARPVVQTPFCGKKTPFYNPEKAGFF